MGIKITDMTAGGTANGTEILPASKAGAPRSVTTANIKDYVKAQIEALAAGVAPAGADSLYALQGGALKPIDIDLVTQYVMDAMWAKTAETSLADGDKLPLYDVSQPGENTVALSVLAEYVRTKIEAAILDVSDLASGSGTLAVTDYLLVTQGTTGKRITVQNLYDAIYAGFATYLNALGGSGAGQATDELVLERAGTAYKITLAQIATYVASGATLDGGGTAGYLASWADANTLDDTYAVVPSGTGIGSGSDTGIPTTAAVLAKVNSLINDAADIGAAVVDADTILVDDGAAGTQRKSAISRLWTWLKLKTDLPVSMIDLDAATDIGGALADADLILVDDGAGGTNRKSALSRVWTWLKTKTDAPLSMLDIVGGTDIGEAVVETDVVPILNASSGVNSVSTLARIWLFIQTQTYAAPWRVASYTVGTLPAAGTPAAGSIVYVSNESGGAVLAFTDGTNWRRVTDRAIVS